MTTGPAAKLMLQADRNRIKSDRLDLSFVSVTIADSAGHLVPHSKNHISFAVSGPGEIVATDNGDATSLEPFQAPERNAFNGLCLAILRSTGQAGTMVLKANSPGLAPAEVKVEADAAR